MNARLRWLRKRVRFRPTHVRELVSSSAILQSRLCKLNLTIASCVECCCSFSVHLPDLYEEPVMEGISNSLTDLDSPVQWAKQKTEMNWYNLCTLERPQGVNWHLKKLGCNIVKYSSLLSSAHLMESLASPMPTTEQEILSVMVQPKLMRQSNALLSANCFEIFCSFHLRRPSCCHHFENVTCQIKSAFILTFAS